MNIQVLSIEQCKELIELGIDMSNASCVWWNFFGGFSITFLNNGREPITLEEKKTVYGDENVIPTFTLQDILEMLPDIGKDYVNHPHIFKASDGINWYCSYGTMTCEIMGETPLDAAFKMLKWCKENNHI